MEAPRADAARHQQPVGADVADVADEAVDSLDNRRAGAGSAMQGVREVADAVEETRCRRISCLGARALSLHRYVLPCAQDGA